MFRILLKKQMTEIFRAYFMMPKRTKNDRFFLPFCSLVFSLFLWLVLWEECLLIWQILYANHLPW